MSQRSRRRGGPPHDRAWADYTDAFRRRVLPHLLSSTAMVSIGVTATPDTLDLQAATELGLMLLLDKPLLLVVPVGETAPVALRRAAAIVLDDVDITDPASQDRLAEAFTRLGLEPR